jgi:lauroyl/myristoyl acyltransferase
MGAFELLHKLPYPDIYDADKNFTVLVAPAFSHVLTSYLNLGRRNKNKHIMLNRSLPAAVLKTRRTRGVLGVMLDQSPARQDDFLTLWKSIQLPFNHRLLEISAEKGFVLLPLSTRLDRDGSAILEYQAQFTPPSEREPAGKAWKELIRNFLEKEIARAPEQWNWSYPGIRVASE